MKNTKGFVNSKTISLAIMSCFCIAGAFSFSAIASPTSQKIVGSKINHKHISLIKQNGRKTNSSRFNANFGSLSLSFYTSNGYMSNISNYSYDHINSTVLNGNSCNANFYGYYYKKTKNFKKDGSYSVQFGPFSTTTSNLAYYRIVTFYPKKNLIRWLDVFTNTGKKKIPVTFQNQSYINNTPNPQTNLKGNKLNGKKHFATWFNTRNGQNLSVGLHIANDRSSKIRPTNSIESYYFKQTFSSFSIKPKSTVILASFTGFFNTNKKAAAFAKKFKASDYLKDLDPSIKNAIINFNLSTGFASLELNRSECYDKIILADNTPMMGALQNKEYEISTKYGKVKIPAKDMIGMAKKKGAKDQYLILLADGQVLSGKIAPFKLNLKLDGIGLQAVPSSDIKEFSYQISKKKPTEFKFQGGFVVTKSGDRLSIDKHKLNTSIRLGSEVVKLDPKHVHKIVFDPRLDPEMRRPGMPTVGFTKTAATDNSKKSIKDSFKAAAKEFAKQQAEKQKAEEMDQSDSVAITPIVPAEPKDSSKTSNPPAKTKSAPAATATKTTGKPVKICPRVYFKNGSVLDAPILNNEVEVTSPIFGKIKIKREEVAMLTFTRDQSEPVGMTTFILKNGNTLLGKIFDQTLSIKAKYGKIKVKPQNIRSIEAKDDKGTYAISLWNGTVLTGKFEKSTIAINILPGPKLNIDIASMKQIIRAVKSTADELRTEIIKLITLLGSDSYSDRESAQKKLTNMGAKILPILKKKLSVADPEIRQRLKKIIEDLEDTSSSVSAKEIENVRWVK